MRFIAAILFMVSISSADCVAVATCATKMHPTGALLLRKSMTTHANQRILQSPLVVHIGFSIPIEGRLSRAKANPTTNAQEAPLFDRPFQAQETNAHQSCGLELQDLVEYSAASEPAVFEQAPAAG